jgi:hypothetical protein
MPQPALHVLFALEALERWQRSPSLAPFDASSAASRNAMLQGALAPDMGYFPWGDSGLSDLTHTARTGRVARELLRMARTDEEKAFAYGWLSHILADVEVHPLVNAEAARLVSGGGTSLIAHVRVELGADFLFFDRTPQLRRHRLWHAFDRATIGLLADALCRTYQLPFQTRQLLSIHRNVTRFYNAYLALAALHAPVIGRAMEGSNGRRRRDPVVLSFLRAAARVLGRKSLVRAFLHPTPPAAAFIERVSGALHRCREQLDGYVAHGLSDLPDLDLENGGMLTELGAYRAQGRVREQRRGKPSVALGWS